MGVTPLNHWYVGVPPLMEFAEKVTGVPAQMAPEGEADILTLAGNNGFTVIVIILDVAGLPVWQVLLEVRIQDIISPLFGI